MGERAAANIAAWHYLNTSEKLRTGAMQPLNSDCIQAEIPLKLQNISALQCVHTTDSRQHKESRGLFSQLRWAESSAIEKNRDRERKKGICMSVPCIESVQHPGKTQRWDDSLTLKAGCLEGSRRLTLQFVPKTLACPFGSCLQSCQRAKVFKHRRCQSLSEWTMVHFTKALK